MKQEKLISNTYDQDDVNYINEECTACHYELTNTKDIFVIVDDDRYLDDRYICKECAEAFDFKVVPCAELD